MPTLSQGKEPLLSDKNKHEVDMMHEGQVLITFLHPANHEMVRTWLQKVIGLTLDQDSQDPKGPGHGALTLAGCRAQGRTVCKQAAQFMPMIGFSGMLRPRQ